MQLVENWYKLTLALGKFLWILTFPRWRDESSFFFFSGKKKTESQSTCYMYFSEQNVIIPVLSLQRRTVFFLLCLAELDTGKPYIKMTHFRRYFCHKWLEELLSYLSIATQPPPNDNLESTTIYCSYFSSLGWWQPGRAWQLPPGVTHAAAVTWNFNWARRPKPTGCLNIVS